MPQDLFQLAACDPDASCWLGDCPRAPLLLLYAGIRDHFVQSVELKFNCFFLMPIIDTFPTRLREELESAYDEDLDEVRGGCWGGRSAELNCSSRSALIASSSLLRQGAGGWRLTIPACARSRSAPRPFSAGV